MRGGWRGGVAIAAASALLLAGCSPAAPAPTPPTDAEARAYAQGMLDRMWSGMTLSNSGAQPISPDPLLDHEEWIGRIASCLATSGFDASSISWTPDGYYVARAGGDIVSPSGEQEALYRCGLLYTLDPVSSGLLVSDSQLDYLWWYYQHWLVPCLIGHGFELGELMSREAFDETGGAWSPYWAVLTDTTQTGTALASAICGPERGVLSTR